MANYRLRAIPRLSLTAGHMRALCLALFLLVIHVVALAQPLWPPTYQEPLHYKVEVPAPADLPWTTQEAVMRYENLKKARVDNKYRMLMLQFDAPDSVKTYGEFHEVGLSTGPGGVTMPQGLPQKPLRGYWVYVEPSWYVWHELVQADKADIKMDAKNQDGGLEQVLGPPNTTYMARPSKTAWRAKSADAPPGIKPGVKLNAKPNDKPIAVENWLLLEFANPTEPHRLRIYESLHPGAITRITLMALDGSEVEVWSGNEPTRAVKKNAAMFELTFKRPPEFSFIADFEVNRSPRTIFAAQRVKLYLNPALAPDGSEIDAVCLLDFSNQPNWAIAAIAGSSQAQPNDQDDAELPGALIGGWQKKSTSNIPLLDLSSLPQLVR